MNDRQREAAREAAAAYPTDLKRATVEYANLLGRGKVALNEEEQKELYNEMCSFLEPYRRPVGDELGEYLWFVDPDGLVGEGTAFQYPSFLKELQTIGVESELYNKIVEYVTNCERIKIVAKKCEVELKEHHDILKMAEEVYSNNIDKRSDARNKLVAQSLGLSKGCVPKRIDEKKVYHYYMVQVRHEGLTRADAVVKTQL